MRDLEGSKTDELLTMLEELQDENESLQIQISEAQQTTSQLSSENSVLKSELQKKSATIVSLNALIEKQSGSDLVFRRNEQLERQNRELQQSAQEAREEAADMISAVKKEYSKKEQELERKLCKAAQREEFARKMEVEYEAKVDAEANRLTERTRLAAEHAYRQRVVKAENEYIKKRDAIRGLTVGCLLYGFFATILTACNSARFVKDVLAFISVLWGLLPRPVLLAVKECKEAWSVRDMIPYQILNVIVAALLTTLVFVLIIGLLYGILGFLVVEAARFYHKEFWDLVSAVVALESLGLLAWFADKLNWLTWNLVLVWLFIHAAYILIRMMASGRKSSQS